MGSEWRRNDDAPTVGPGHLRRRGVRGRCRWGLKWADGEAAEKMIDLHRVQAMAVLVLGGDGNLKTEKLGPRTWGGGRDRTHPRDAYPGRHGCRDHGGGILGALHHKGLSISNDDRERLGRELQGGKAALGVMTDKTSAAVISSELASLGGTIEIHELDDATIAAADAAASTSPSDRAGHAGHVIGKGVRSVFSPRDRKGGKIARDELLSEADTLPAQLLPLGGLDCSQRGKPPPSASARPDDGFGGPRPHAKWTSPVRCRVPYLRGGLAEGGGYWRQCSNLCRMEARPSTLLATLVVRHDEQVVDGGSRGAAISEVSRLTVDRPRNARAVRA